jgi:hypothetical protein
MTTWIAAIAAAAAVIATIIAWLSRRDSARSASAAERAAQAAERSAKADDELRHQARAPRFELRLGPSSGDWRPAELVLLGPERLSGIDIEIGGRIWEDEDGTAFDAAGWLRFGELDGPSEVLSSMDPGDLHGFEVSTAEDFWLRLTCKADDGEVWVVSVRVPASETDRLGRVWPESWAI